MVFFVVSFISRFFLSQAEKVNQRTSFTTPDGIYIGKKRKAHEIEPQQYKSEAKLILDSNISKNDTAQVSAIRPQIPVEFGSKVPQVIRQRYLNKIIDEYTPKIKSLEEVYSKVTFTLSIC